MGLFGFIKGQFIEVIEATDFSKDLMVFQFPVDNHEIKMGAQLTVREGQCAIFVNEGVIADIYGPGLTDEAARLAGTIPYELLCHVTARVPRIYWEHGKKLE